MRDTRNGQHGFTADEANSDFYSDEALASQHFLGSPDEGLRLMRAFVNLRDQGLRDTIINIVSRLATERTGPHSAL